MTDWRVDLLERSYVAFEGLDPDVILPLYAPDCEWILGELGLAFGTTHYEGHDGLRSLIASLREIFPDWSPRIEEIRERDDGALLVTFRAVGTAQRGGVPLDVQAGQIVEFADGLIARITQTTTAPPGWEEAKPIPT